MKSNYFGNQYESNFVGKVARFTKKWIKRSAIVCIVAWMCVGALKAGQHYFPQTVYAEKTVEVQVDKGIPPVMQRIAKCESGNTHIDPKTGQVIMRSNTNNTVDVGRYQINSVWFKKATELGLDITKEKDNEKMAMFIYENYGTEDWVYSSKCWSK